MRPKIALLTLALAACSSKAELPAPTDRAAQSPDGKATPTDADGKASPTDADGKASSTAPDFAGELAASTRPRLQWKRYAALEADLASALELPRDQLCTEFGSASCIRDVHLVPLGGHEPFSTGMLEPAAEPLGTTSTVVDRVVLSACSARVELDRSEHKLFDFDLQAKARLDVVPSVGTTLYRRLHARDPEQVELDALRELVVDDAGKPIAGDEFAKLACFLVGSVSEFIFF